MDFAKTTRRTVLIVVLLGGITLAAFWPVVHNDFVNYDDTAYVTENPHVLAGLSLANAGWVFRTSCLGNWHPLTMLSHMMDVQLFGLNPGWHHCSSLCFHVANTVLLFLLLRRLTSRVWPSAFVAALFALHPLHVESVAWVSERKDVLSTFFGLLSLLAYARFAEVQSRETEVQSPMSKVQGWEPEVQGSRFEVQGSKLPASFFYVLSLFLFALGLMCKAMVVTLPFVMLLLDFWPLRRFQLPRLWTLDFRLRTSSPHPSTIPPLRLILEKLPFFALAVVVTCVSVLLLSQAGATNEVADIGLGNRLARSLVAYQHYLIKTIWPANLALPYLRPAQWPLWETLSAAAVVGAVSFGTLWQGRRRPYLLVGWFWFLGTLVPVIGLIPVGAHAMADRYTYFPLIGLFVALVWTATEIAPGGRYQPAALAAVGVGVLLVCAVVTSQQVRLWRNSETLFLHAAEVTRGNYVAHNGVGLHYFKQGRVDEAVRQYAAALQMNPLYDAAHSNLGRALAGQRRYDEAVTHFETALSLRPDDVKTRNNLGNVLAQQGRHAEAVREFEEALRLNPDHVTAHNNVAISYKKLGRIGEAIAHYREAIRLQPDSVEAINNLAWLLAAHPDAQFRNGAEAVPLATRACELTKYQNPVALTTLAAAYAETGQFQTAISFAERAQELAKGSQGALAERLSAMLEAFRAGRPYYQP
jgi:Flp pilus assembly protein TadD